MSDLPKLPKFEVLKRETRQSLLIQFEPTDWVDYEKALDILSFELRPTLEPYINTLMNDRGIRAIEASIMEALITMRDSDFIFLRRGKWDLNHRGIRAIEASIVPDYLRSRFVGSE